MAAFFVRACLHQPPPPLLLTPSLPGRKEVGQMGRSSSYRWTVWCSRCTSLSIPYYRRIERMTALLRSLAGQSFQRPFTLFQIQPQTRKKPSSVHFVQLRVLSQDGNSFFFVFRFNFSVLGSTRVQSKKTLVRVFISFIKMNRKSGV